MKTHLIFLTILLPACALVKNNADYGLNDAGQQQLTQKLDEVAKSYQLARKNLVDKVVTNHAEMPRNEWESLLTITPPINSEDLLTLEKTHQEIVTASQQNAVQTSVLDLEKVRTDGKIAEFCHQFPKGAMLHIHPWGTLDETTVRKILAAVDPEIDFNDLHADLSTPGDSGILFPRELTDLQTLSKRYNGKSKYSVLTDTDKDAMVKWFFLPKGPQDFDRFLGVFTIISKLVFANPAVDPEPMMYEAFFRRAQEHNVQYVEISQFVKNFPAWVNALTPWADQVKLDHNIEVSLLAAFSRARDSAATKKAVDRLLKLPKSKRLTGVNFLADEGAHPALEKGQSLYAPLIAYEESGNTNLRTTMHAGELGDSRNPRDAIIMGVQRIGHGVKLRNDPVATEMARRLKIHIEANLISNLRLKTVNSIAEHPFLYYLRLGIPVSWSTDDEGIFESTISDECTTAVEKTDIAYSELKLLAISGIEGAFIDDTVKLDLMKELRTRFLTFETNWQSYKR